eukprot:364743-Chlamydomonas_euryale.AAC.46
MLASAHTHPHLCYKASGVTRQAASLLGVHICCLCASASCHPHSLPGARDAHRSGRVAARLSSLPTGGCAVPCSWLCMPLPEPSPPALQHIRGAAGIVYAFPDQYGRFDDESFQKRIRRALARDAFCTAKVSLNDAIKLVMAAHVTAKASCHACMPCI